MVWGLRLCVFNFEFRVYDQGLGDWGFRVFGFIVRVWRLRFGGWGLGLVSGFGAWSLGLGNWGSGFGV
jgi:hypothetical protein